MKKLFHSAYSAITGKNSVNAPVDMIKDQLTEKRELPIGLAAFHEWSDRIISGAGLPADADSQKYALANDLMHCSPNTAFESDVYFIHRLRKYAVNQVADQVRKDLYAAAKAREESKPKQNPAEVTPTSVTDAKVLDIKGI